MRTHATATSKMDRKKKKKARQGGRLSRSTGTKNTSASAGGAKKSARSKRPKSKTTPKTTRSGSKKPVPIGPESFFPKLRAGDGDAGKGVFIALAERSETVLSIQTVAWEQSPRKQACITSPASESIARILVGLAHTDRIRLLITLESGEQTHKSLAEAVSLKPGPFYHHLRTLERAGLVRTTARNRYSLTPTGEAALRITSGLWAITHENRRVAPWHRHRSRMKCAKNSGKR